MKKVVVAIVLSVLFGASLTACGAAGAEGQEAGSQEAGSAGPETEGTQVDLQDTRSEDPEETQSEDPEETQSEDPEDIQEKDPQDTQSEGPKRMFVCDGKLYEDTGETNSMLRCGTMDGNFTSTVDPGEIPTEEGQTNFGADHGFQYGMRENRREVCIDGVWHVFAHNENNFDGVSMEVAENTATGAVLQITNTTDLEVDYGEDYRLEVKNKKTGEWECVPYIIDNAAFNDIAYTVPKDEPQTWEVDWKEFHGKLGPGEYRIVKTFMDFRGTGDYTEYTLMAGFTVDEK